MKNLQLSLKQKWFDLTKSGEKTEDYRELTPYWCARLLYKIPYPHGGYFNASNDILKGDYDCIGWNEFAGGAPLFEKFTTNTMTLGYPKSTDTERILHYEHKGIEIRTGKPEWGAEPGKIYFVIMHGKQILKPE